MALLLRDPFYDYWPQFWEPFNEFFEPLQYQQHQQNRDIATFDKDRFQANVDVQQFKPDEITVKVGADNTITIEGKHEEKRDEHGFIARHFVRRYVLPDGHDIDRVESKLSSDGVLTITAPKLERKSANERLIPITRTGRPSKPAAAEKKRKDKK